MQRRQILQAACASAVPTFSFAQATTQANTPEDFFRDFASAHDRNPQLTPLQGVSADLQCDTLRVEGKLPSALKGRFLRNGPALHQRAGRRYQHWFAGDGMVQKFTFSGSGVAHLGRFVRTAKFEREQAAGKFLYSAFNTFIDKGESVSGPDAVNTANTNAIEHGGQVLAMWEGGSAYAMDPVSLNTKGPVQWQEGWAQMPFSAHPKVDPQGHLWNIGGANGTLVTYHVRPDGGLEKAQIAKLPIDRTKSGGMIHDMAVTARYLVVPIPPVTMDFRKLSAKATAGDVLKIHHDEPLRIWVAEKEDISRAKVFELPSAMVFHVGNAYEQGDELVLHMIEGANNEFLTSSAVNIMRGVITEPGESHLTVVRLNLRTGTSSTLAFKDVEEFPRLDPRFIGRPSRYLVTPTSWRNAPVNAPSFGFHGLRVRDMARGSEQRFDYGDAMAVEEHIVVPKPGTANELNAWILGTAFDAKSQTTCVNVFEAQRIQDGPVARAWLPYAMPLGFHGNFTAS